MSNIAIRVEGVGKQYQIGALQKQQNRLGDQISDLVVAPLRRTGKILRGRARSAAELDETIWALRDVSFEIKQGEVVGVIGRNGAGKSTLLKILSRITEPTEGLFKFRGRVGSLLEVGTGFHPELTGRENVYLNGAILGMRKSEIDYKFDEIVAFAEIDKFIDTPVKHYSSGMYVRLAFSVAGHLEPEILLVDEVLAVGDISFQKKCLGKMNDVAQKGRTVLFVSHNMSVIQSLCHRGIYLNEGRLVADCEINRAIGAYLRSLEQAYTKNLDERTDRAGQGKVRLIGLDIIGGNGSISTLKTGEPARFIFRVDKRMPGLACTFSLINDLGIKITTLKSSLNSPQDVHNASDVLEFICEFDSLLLMPGRYRVDAGIIADDRLQDFVSAAAYCDVDGGLVQGRPLLRVVGNKKGQADFSVHLPHRWLLPKT